MYSYCPSIGLKGHNISTDSCTPTVPPLDWKGTISLKTHVLLLSLYWTERAQYLYRHTYSYCPSIGLKGHNISTDSCTPTVPLLDWVGTISLQTHVLLLSLYRTEWAQYLYRLMYSYCPSIGLSGHNISTDSCTPTVPLLDWVGTISLQTHVLLLSLYRTERAQYLYRLMSSYCPSIGPYGHNISTDSCIPTVPLLDWKGTVSLQTHVLLLSLYWTEWEQYLYRLMYSYYPSIGLNGHNISTRLMYSYCPATGLLLKRSSSELTHIVR